MTNPIASLIDSGWPTAAARRLEAALSPGPALVALDFDNTLIVGDVGETLHYAMCEHFAYALDEDDFWSALPELVGASALRKAWQDLASTEAGRRSAAARARGLDIELIAVFARHFVAFGPQATFDWAATLFAGLRPAQLRQLAADAFERELSREIEVVRAQSADGIPLRMNRGIRTCAAATSMLSTMRDANADLWVVSATNRWALEAIAPRFGLRADRILANGCIETNGRITRRRDGPTTWHDGKVAAFEARHGRAPDVVVGDSVSDAPLMRTATRLAVLIDRGDEALRREAIDRDWVVVSREQLGRAR